MTRLRFVLHTSRIQVQQITTTPHFFPALLHNVREHKKSHVEPKYHEHSISDYVTPDRYQSHLWEILGKT